MKYIAIFDDASIADFRRDETDKLTLVMYGEAGATRYVKLKPVIRPTVTLETGESVYITQGHMDALIKYEKDEFTKEVIERMNKSLDFIQQNEDLWKRGKKDGTNT